MTCTAAGSEHAVRAATADDVAAAADALADAFAGYPWTDWITPEEGRRERLRGLHEVMTAHVGVPFGLVHVATCPAGDVVGVATVLRPDRPVPHRVWEEIAPTEAGLVGDRADEARAADELAAALRPDHDVVTVATVGVRPEHRRRGLATRLLAPALALADELGVPAHLETSTEGNVALYRGLGFAVTGSVQVPGGPTVWSMERPVTGRRPTAAPPSARRPTP